MRILHLSWRYSRQMIMMSSAIRPASTPVAFTALLAICVASSARTQTTPPARLMIGPRPTLVLGAGGAPETEFFRIRAAWRLNDGSVAVVDGGTSEIRVFSPRGVYRYSFGRTGEGPGEFRNIDW